MKVGWIAAGFAVGYVLGAKAGRGRYQQIVEAAREWSNKPAVVEARVKVKELAERGSDAVMAKVDDATS